MRALPEDLIELNDICKTLFPNEVTFTGHKSSWLRIQHSFWGHTAKPLTKSVSGLLPDRSMLHYLLQRHRVPSFPGRHPLIPTPFNMDTSRRQEGRPAQADS